MVLLNIVKSVKEIPVIFKHFSYIKIKYQYFKNKFPYWKVPYQAC